MAQWWTVNDDGLGILPGNATVGGGGNVAAQGAVQFRSPIDAARASSGQLGQAQYPDGYLGTIIDRRSDKLIQAVKNQLTSQSYQRGVHKGSRVDPHDYLWPDGFVSPDSGLERQAAGAHRTGYTISTPRFAPLGNPVERLAHMGKTSGMATPGEIGKKLEEGRQFGVDSSMNPIIPQDPHLQEGTFIPRYRIARNSRTPRTGEFESGK
jgi:hypothetical protein